MKKWIWLLVALAGCVKPASDRIEITYQTIETLPEQQALHRQIVAAFEAAHPGVHVNVIYDTSKWQKLNVQLAGGAAPDAFYFVVDRLPALAKRGVVRDVSAEFAPVAVEFAAEVVEPCRIEGKLFMMPFHYSTDLLFCNRDWFEKAGEPMPDETWDWAKFAEAAKRLAKARDERYATVLPRPLLLMQSFGAQLFAAGKCAINTPEAIAGLELYELLVRYGLPTPAAMGEMEAFDGVNLFRAQKIAMLIGRTYMLSEFDKITEFRWDASPVPKGKVRWSRLSVGGNCVWSGTKHPRETWDFVKFYSTEGAKLSASARNAIPAFKAAAQMAALPAVAKDALAYSHLDNPWGFTWWDEFNQKALVTVPEGLALGHLAPDEAAVFMQALGDNFVKGTAQ
jgi:multiple sugar transport system substrate-binding protein